MSFMKIEQETMISFNAGEDEALLYTADPVMRRKMDKLVEENPQQFKIVDEHRFKGEVYARRYTLPKKFVSIRTKDIKPREMSDEQRRACSERMKQLRAAQLTREREKQES